MSEKQKKELQDALKGMRLSKKEMEVIKGGAAASAAEVSMASLDVRAVSSANLAAERVSLNTAVQVDTSMSICGSSAPCQMSCYFCAVWYCLSLNSCG